MLQLESPSATKSLKAPSSTVLLALKASRKIQTDRENLPDDLGAFLRAAWHVLEPATTYVHSWHIDAICEHLEAVKSGQIRNLVINMPPRHIKSILVSVVFPVWMWTDQPHIQFLCASYSSILSTRDALKARRLITSQWFQSRWGEVFALTGDQNVKTRYENDRNGYRIATSVGGSGTGEGGDIEIADDPLNALDAHSEAAIETANTWWDQTMSTRLNDPRTGARIIVMQRLHENDPTGHVLASGGYEHLCLPAEYEGSTAKTSIGWSDPRKVKGELLWPERFGQDEIDALKAALGTYGSAGQLQQRPAPEEGGIIKGHWLRTWEAGKPLPTFNYVVQSYDTAFTASTENDPTAMSCWGVFNDDKTGWGVMLLDCWEEFLEYPALRKKCVAEWSAVYGHDDAKVSAVLIEEKGSGIPLIQDLRRAGVPVQAYNPGRADKVQRMHSISHLVEGGKVWIPESSRRKGDFVDWSWALVRQLLMFPNATRDDYCDTFSQVLALLRDQQWIVTDADRDLDPDPYPKDSTPRVNPYAM